MKFSHKHKFIFVAALMVFVLQTGCAGANADLATQMPSNQTVTSSTQDTQNMNLTQIQAGDYSSLLGNWILVAYADNLFDGKGQQWHAGAPDTVTATLSVSSDKIVFNDTAMVMQGNTLTDDAGSHLLSFVNDGTSLDAYLADAYTAITWGVTFYPKGVANNLEPNNGVQIDNSKNLIVVYYSGMRVETVFEQQ
ncbi:DUF6287 domain-containing protein [Lachnospiraceae bacterium OttesenSCG-928-D06]|nr:DUF6287 domain-containing protein [Lachnospiraceae bacterium OttesenSCG-928-D06]